MKVKFYGINESFLIKIFNIKNEKIQQKSGHYAKLFTPAYIYLKFCTNKSYGTILI